MAKIWNVLTSRIQSFLCGHTRGAVAIEYGLIAAMIAAVTIVSVDRVGGSLAEKFNEFGIGVGENPDVPPTAGDLPVALGADSGPAEQPASLGSPMGSR